MQIVGVTGGIGSGKSTVSRIFNVLGIPVYDADSRAKQLMEENDVIKNQIIALFGNTAYVSGKLNRSVISGIVFHDTEKLKQLNAIVHPVTIADAKSWMAKQNSPYVIKEAALIFESGSDQELDGVIGITAPEKLRIQRVMQRDHVSPEQVESRMNRQMDETQKMKLCRWHIDNDEQKPLIEQVLKLHQELKALAKTNVNK